MKTLNYISLIYSLDLLKSSKSTSYALYLAFGCNEKSASQMVYRDLKDSHERVMKKISKYNKLKKK